MQDLYISVDQLVDIAVAMPRVGVLDLAAMHSLLHIIVRKLNLDNCIIEYSTQSKQIPKFLQSKTLAIGEYYGGNFVERDFCDSDKSIIRTKQMKRRPYQGEHEMVANIVDEIVDGIFKPKDHGLVGTKSSIYLVQSLLGDLFANVISAGTKDEAEHKEKSDQPFSRSKRSASRSGEITFSESELKSNRGRKATAKRKSKSKRGSDSSDIDSFDENDPLVRTSQIGPMVSQIIDGKSKPKKKSKKSDLFEQFEQLIKDLDATEGKVNRTEFRDFLQNLLDEIKTKTRNYLMEVREEREMKEQPTAKDLYNHVEIQVNNSLIDDSLKEHNDDFNFHEDDEHRDLHKMMKGSGAKPRRPCGGEHTIVQSNDRQTPRADFKEKYIDLVANQMKTTLRNSISYRKPKSRRCCKYANCTCYHANSLSAVYGMALI